MPCMCGDICCPSCGPAQGNYQCPACGAWASEGGCKCTPQQQQKAIDEELAYLEGALEDIKNDREE